MPRHRNHNAYAQMCFEYARAYRNMQPMSLCRRKAVKKWRNTALIRNLKIWDWNMHHFIHFNQRRPRVHSKIWSKWTSLAPPFKNGCFEQSFVHDFGQKSPQIDPFLSILGQFFKTLHFEQLFSNEVYTHIQNGHFDAKNKNQSGSRLIKELYHINTWG